MSTTVTTRDGRQITLISQADLWDPIFTDGEVRAYCHLHGGDKQRSLSISREGWGFCHNCHQRVLLQEFSPDIAQRLLRRASAGQSTSRTSEQGYRQPARPQRMATPPKRAPQWQQDEQRLLLSLDGAMREALSRSWKARAYLEERALLLSVALERGMGYFPRAVLDWPELHPHKDILCRWSDRLLFPLNSPQGRGYIGRSLWRWEPGLDENQHKAMLDQPQTPRRWRKTNPAGWFGYEPGLLSDHLVLVEGGFDRLALLSAGLRASDVLALAGTAARPEWLTGQIQAVVLALDADNGGLEAMQRLAEQFARAGLGVELCPPPQDQWGKDWNERWRRIGPQCVWPIYEALAKLSKVA